MSDTRRVPAGLLVQGRLVLGRVLLAIGRIVEPSLLDDLLDGGLPIGRRFPWSVPLRPSGTWIVNARDLAPKWKRFDVIATSIG